MNFWDFDTPTALCEALIPGVPCYIERVRDHPSLSHPRANAYTGWRVDMLLRPALEKRGDWRGRGFGTVLISEDDPTLPDIANRCCTTFTVLHELCHFLEYAVPLTEPTPEELAELTATLPKDAYINSEGQKMLEQLQRGEEPVGHPKWYLHPAKFFQMTHHVGARVGIAPERLADPAKYGLSPVDAYAEALGPEVELCMACDDDVLPLWHPSKLCLAAMRVPPAFQALYDRDTNNGGTT